MSQHRPSTHRRPGRVREIKGIAFQSDGQSAVGARFIRPVESANRRVAGVRCAPDGPPLAMHAGIHVALDNGEEWVAEQLHGTFENYLKTAFNWTPIETFRERDRGGWEVTIPATAFRRIDAEQVAKTVERLNTLGGHPFLREDCTAFIEHMFSHQLFAHVPMLGWLGLDVPIGDPAMPLLRPDARLDPEAARLLRLDELRQLEDTPWGFRPPAISRAAPPCLAAGIVGATVGYLLAGRR